MPNRKDVEIQPSGKYSIWYMAHGCAVRVEAEVDCMLNEISNSRRSVARPCIQQYSNRWLTVSLNDCVTSGQVVHTCFYNYICFLLHRIYRHRVTKKSNKNNKKKRSIIKTYRISTVSNIKMVLLLERILKGYLTVFVFPILTIKQMWTLIVLHNPVKHKGTEMWGSKPIWH